MDNKWQIGAMALFVGVDATEFDQWYLANTTTFNALAERWREFFGSNAVIGLSAIDGMPVEQAKEDGLVWWNDESHSTHIVKISEVLA